MLGNRGLFFGVQRAQLAGRARRVLLADDTPDALQTGAEQPLRVEGRPARECQTWRRRQQVVLGGSLGGRLAVFSDHQERGRAAADDKLLEQIGEGGTGTVRVAEQSEPVRGMVALKIVN